MATTITIDHGLAGGESHPAISDRTFGWVMGGLCTVIGLWPTLFARSPRVVFLGAAIVFAGLAAIRPGWLSRPKVVWFGITGKIAAFVTLVLTAVIFFAVFTPLAVAMRLSGRDPLRRRLDPSAPSYWIPRTGSEAVGAAMKRQF